MKTRLCILFVVFGAALAQRDCKNGLFIFLLTSLVDKATFYPLACGNGDKCMPLTRCRSLAGVAEKLQRVSSDAEKVNLLDVIKAARCNKDKGNSDSGNNVDVCCPAAQISKLTWHTLSGSVHVKDENTLEIRNFAYDGLGPDAFFLVGVETPRPPKGRRASYDDAIPLPYFPPSHPSGQTNEPNRPKLSFRSQAVPVLGEYDIQTLEVPMPAGVSAHSVKWLSIYCRDYSIDFGHAIIPNLPRT